MAGGEWEERKNSFFDSSLIHLSIRRMFLLTHRTKIVLGLRSSLTGVLFLHQLIPLRRAETKEVITGVVIGQKTNTKSKLQNKHAKSWLLPPANWVEKLEQDNTLFLLFINQVGVD